MILLRVTLKAMNPARRLALILLVALPALSIQSAHACKPCLGDRVDTSIQRAKAVLLAKVVLVSEYPSSAKKHGAGEAAIEVRVERWLKKPASGAAKKGRKVPLRIRWDGICVGRPVLPKAGDQAIFFIGESTPEKEGVLTGYCSAPYLRVRNGKVVLPAESADSAGSSSISLRALESRLKK
jgi:hypothetical protein